LLRLDGSETCPYTSNVPHRRGGACRRFAMLLWFRGSFPGLSAVAISQEGKRIRVGCNPSWVARPYFQGKEINGLSGAAIKGGVADAAVLAAIRSGDENGMAALYDRYSAVVYSVALRVLGDTGAAEDVLQEVFMQLWRNPGLFDSSRGSLGPWLAVIARHRAIDGLRKRRPETDIADVVVSVEPDLAGDAERARAMEKVRGTLGSMPAPQRQALEMAYFEGLSHSEISAKTGEPLGTIKTRIRAGLLALRKAFAT
jgi:RNA polymerase sigma-70 factor (ECF subfamily)